MNRIVIPATGERTLPSQNNRYEFERIYHLVSNQHGGGEKSALDYGCGTGYGTVLLAAHFGRVVGVDVCPEVIAFCNQTYKMKNLRFEVLDPSLQPFPDQTFDFIGSFQVFEHIRLDATETFIRYIWAMLKPGGTAVITTPNAKNYSTGFSGNPFHIKEYTRDEVEGSFAAILPSSAYRVLAFKDVPSTWISLAIRRVFRDSRMGILLSCAASLPLRMLERKGLISMDPHRMVKEGRDDVIGSFLVEIRKPG